MPIGLMNRWELITYHLNTIARSNRSFSDHPKSYWNKKRRLMRNDKDFVIGMNTLGHAMASLFKSFNLIDTSDHEEMYWFTIFKDAIIYHLLQFHINSNHIYGLMTQIIYNQLCDHPVGSMA